MINGGAKTDGRLGGALDFFQLRLSALSSENPARLRDLFNTLRQRLEFVYATLGNENPYSIFKSLNSIGIPLGQSDLIRNFVFMHVHPDSHEVFDHEWWSPLESQFSRANGTLDEDPSLPIMSETREVQKIL